MIACPGCGLPRGEDQIGVVPCPVCAAAPGAAPILPRSIPPPPPDPVAGLPADASQMEAPASVDSSRRVFLAATVSAFLLGVAAGAGGLLTWQQRRLVDASFQLPVEPPTDTAGANPPAEHIAAVAPMPHSAVERIPGPDQVKASAATKDSPERQIGAPAMARKVVIPLNQPEAAYTIPGPVDRGEHVVLRGKVRMLRVNGLQPGAILDASELEAGSIYVDGKIDGGAWLKLSCPDGVVEVPARVGGRSRVEIDAPGSSVRFPHPTTSAKPGSLIDGASTVTIVGRTVDLRGDVEGAGTSVRVTLTRNGRLQVATVRGRAEVEYQSAEPLADPPATVATVEPTVVFRKLPAR